MGCETCVLGAAACHRACEVLFNVILVVPEQVCISILLCSLWVIFVSVKGWLLWRADFRLLNIVLEWNYMCCILYILA